MFNKRLNKRLDVRYPLTGILCLVFLTIIATSLVLADVEAHDITLFVRNSTYDLIAGANITLTQYIPETNAETIIAANITDGSGRALLTGVNDTLTRLYYLDVRIYHNGSANGNTSEMNIRGTPLPGIKFNASMEQNSNGSTIYTVPAIRVHLSAINNSRELVNFSYVVLPASLSSKNLISSRFTAGPSLEIYLPYTLNYSFFFFSQPSLSEELGIPPSQYLFTNFTTYPQQSTIFIQDNLTRTNISLSGYLTFIGNATPANWSLTRGLSQVFAVTSSGSASKGLIPPVGNASQTFSISSSFFYNITLPASSAGIPLMVSLHGANGNSTDTSTEYFIGYQNITAISGNNLQINLTLRRLTGTNARETTTGVNQSYFIVNLVDGDSADAPVTSAFCEATLEVSAAGDGTHLEISRMITAPSSSGQVLFPALMGNFSNATLECFANRFAPLKLDVNTSQNSAAMNFTAFNIKSFSDAGMSDFSSSLLDNTIIRILRSTPSCNVFHPDLAVCTLLETTGEFDPSQIMIPFATVHVTLPDGSILMFVNQQMTGNGIVAPRSKLAADSSQTAGNDVFGFRFGAAVPKDIAAAILVGMRYNESIDDSGNINFSLSTLRDDLGRVVWNRSVDTVIPAYFADYNANLLSATGLLASKTDKSQLVYVNTTNNTLWFNIPHFSESEPQISELVSASVVDTAPVSGGGRRTSTIARTAPVKASSEEAKRALSPQPAKPASTSSTAETASPTKQAASSPRNAITGSAIAVAEDGEDSKESSNSTSSIGDFSGLIGMGFVVMLIAGLGLWRMRQKK